MLRACGIAVGGRGWWVRERSSAGLAEAGSFGGGPGAEEPVEGGGGRRTLGEQVTVETVLGGGLWRAHADPNQLELAILNLAVNARDAMPSGGRLTLETGNVYFDEKYAETQAEVVPGQYVMLGITDNGCGITAEVKAKAFDPFFTTKDIGHGTGLGLSQVYGFAKQSRDIIS